MARDYSEEVRAAVMAALLCGQSVSQVAREYDIPKGTVSGWKRKSSEIAEVATQKRQRIGDLLIAYLTTALETLEAQARMFRNREWLEKQNASDIAVLHGVVTDKAIRLLEALANSDSQ